MTDNTEAHRGPWARFVAWLTGEAVIGEAYRFAGVMAPPGASAALSRRVPRTADITRPDLEHAESRVRECPTHPYAGPCSCSISHAARYALGELQTTCDLTRAVVRVQEHAGGYRVHVVAPVSHARGVAL